MACIGANIHQLEEANFTATVPRVHLPSPFDSLNVSVDAVAQWRVQLSSGVGFTSILNVTADSPQTFCRGCGPQHLDLWIRRPSYTYPSARLSQDHPCGGASFLTVQSTLLAAAAAACDRVQSTEPDFEHQPAWECRPTCELFAMDAAYTADSAAGIVTDRPAVRFAVVCTHAVPLCAGCMRVRGPTMPEDVTLRPLRHLRGRGYVGKASWEERYRGLVQIDLQPPMYAVQPIYCCVGLRPQCTLARGTQSTKRMV